MKFTNYFLHTRERPDRKPIKIEWIEKVHKSPEKEHVQNHGRIRRGGVIEEMDKYLRIVVLEDGETVHNAFFDRNFRK